MPYPLYLGTVNLIPDGHGSLFKENGRIDRTFQKF